jgi:TonB family protein
MRIRLVLPILAALAASPLAAQQARLPSYCRPDTVTRPDLVQKRLLSEAIQDSLRSEIVAAARQAGVAQPAGLIAVQIRDRRRARVEATAFRANVPESIVDSVVAARTALVTRWPERTDHLHVRLDGPFPPADARVECTPGVENSAWFARELGRVVSADRPPAGQMGGARATLTMLVSREGNVVFATLSRTSPRPGVNQGILDAACGLRFRPATLGGVPVDVWVEQPVHF